MPSLASFDPDSVAPATTDILADLAGFKDFAARRTPPVADRLAVAVVLIAKAEGALRAATAYAEGHRAQSIAATNALKHERMVAAVDRGTLSMLRDILRVGSEC